jgi:hypothetical protein
MHKLVGGLCLALLACSTAPEPGGGPAPVPGSGGNGGTRGGTGGAPATPPASGGSGGTASSGTGGAGGVGGGGGGGIADAAPGGAGGSGGSGGGGSAGGGSADGPGPGDGGAADAGEGGSTPVAAIAGELDGAFLQPKCTDTPSNGFCHHSGVIEQKIKFGGEAGKTYDVTLKVWGIMEGIRFSGGEPAGDHFYTGGMSITPRYSPCALKVADKNYYLNRKEDRANDKVYKFEYTTPAIKIPGQAELLLFCVDDASKHISINNPPPLGQAANGRHTIENPPERLKAKLGMQPYAFLFTYLEVASAVTAN